jgi:hypothetical protein
MSDIAELHAQALDHTGRVVAGNKPGRWEAATPGTGWDARPFLAMPGLQGWRR